MKHILKPVGHCLATVVITSSMLKVYPASVADASIPPEVPSSTASEESVQDLPDPSSDESLEPSASVVSPSAPVTVESIVAPEVAGVIVPTTPIAPEPSPQPEPAAIAPAPSTPSPASPAASTAEPTSSPTSAVNSAPIPQSKPSGTSKQVVVKQPAAQPQTLGAMRQQLDEKLAAIVARDQASREAQLQQNLMRIALNYAEVGAFEPAREVARHPALPLELQTALLAQIDQLAAQVPGQSGTQSAPVAAAPSASAQASGRTVPGDAIASMPAYTPSYTSIGRSLPETFAIPQCSAADAPAAQAAVRPSQASEKKPLPGFGNRVAATLASAVKRPTAQPVRSVDAKSSAAKSTAAEALEQKSSTAKPIAEQPVGKPTAAESVTASEKAATPAQPRSLAVRPDSSADSPSAGLSKNLKNSTAQARNLDRFNLQPASPIEIMGYWLSKPLKEAGIRLPFVPVHSQPEPEAQIEVQIEAQTIETGDENSAESAAALSLLSSTSKQTDRSLDLLQPALSVSPYLLDLKQSLADFQLVEKDAVKLSPPAASVTPQPKAQTVSQKTVTPQTAPLDCFSPRAESTSLTVSPALARQMGWGNLVFPLPIPAVLTSAFGWRIHPISGDRRFHAGVDLGAPMGTPVVAAMAGRIVAADYMGGYGLAVIVETAAGSYRNLYAHLSGIAVRPGAIVQQGSVVGWVGSTGNSTGPHLHFETHIPTENGWTAIDPLSATAKTIASRELGQGGGE